MATIIILTPPVRPKQHEQGAQHDAREFERPDGEPLHESLRAIADQIEAEG